MKSLLVAFAFLLSFASWTCVGLAQDAETAQTDAASTDETQTEAASTNAGQEDVPQEPGNVQADDSSSANPNEVGTFWPLFAMGLGVAVVLGLMIGLKAHAFIALILGALTISCFIPLDIVGFAKTPEPHVIRADDGGAPVNIVNRVTSSLGGAVVGIGVLIAMAAIIGKCMLVSGAADRIVKASLAALGEKRAALAMMLSGFVLSIPVFFDTVFYLLVPLARSLYRRTQKNYLLYLAAIAAGGAITHTLVPPTPGPLLVANELNVNIGTVMLIGLAVGFPSALIGLLAAAWLNRIMPIEMRPLSGNSKPEEELEHLPSLPLALLPVLLPVALITVATVFGVYVNSLDDPSSMATALGWMKLVGSPNMAMIIAALFSIYLCFSVQGHSLSELAEHVEDALLSGGVIILITAAGGAFGALLAMTQIQEVVKSLFAGSESGGLIVIVVAYALASIIKMAQGSSTVAMIITSSLVSSIATPLIESGTLGFHPAYLVPVIGAGSLMGSWMNDSGFWVFAKMGVLTEGETLRSWTVLLAILSVSGFLMTLLLAIVFPMTGV